MLPGNVLKKIIRIRLDNKLNEYFLLVLLKIYLDEKDDLNTCLEHIHDFSEYNILHKFLNKKKRP